MQNNDSLKRSIVAGRLTRRELLARTGMGFGTLALGQLLGEPGAAAADLSDPLASRRRSLRPRPSTSSICS